MSSDGESCTLNSAGRYYDILRNAFDQGYQDTYWPEDAIFMERNSRDFVRRNSRINVTTELLCNALIRHDSGKISSAKSTAGSYS